LNASQKSNPTKYVQSTVLGISNILKYIFLILYVVYNLPDIVQTQFQAINWQNPNITIKSKNNTQIIRGVYKLKENKLEMLKNINSIENKFCLKNSKNLFRKQRLKISDKETKKQLTNTIRLDKYLCIQYP